MRIQSVNNNFYQAKLRNNNEPVVETKQTADELAFKGLGDKIGKFYGENYAKKLSNKQWVQDVSKKLSGASKIMTQHMATAGSILTSSVYMYRTMTNKDLDPDKRTTLMINQGACCVVPTICAYGVDHLLKGFNKKMEYRYSGLKMQQMAEGKLDPKKLEVIKERLNSRLAAFGALAGLATFTVIYRYATPVIITPLANWIGEKFNNKKAEKEAAQAESARA